MHYIPADEVAAEDFQHDITQPKRKVLQTIEVPGDILVHGVAGVGVEALERLGGEFNGDCGGEVG